MYVKLTDFCFADFHMYVLKMITQRSRLTKAIGSIESKLSEADSSKFACIVEYGSATTSNCYSSRLRIKGEREL